MLKEQHINSDNQSETNKWFDDMVANLRVDQLLIQSDALEKQRKSVYEAMISGNDDFMHDYARKSSSAFFIKNLISSYFIEIVERQIMPKKLALDLSNSKVLVWAEIENDDEKTEEGLILAAAKINNDFSKYGFHVSSTIVEVDDQISTPKHYREVSLKEV